jgi:hypothetical protein
MEVDKSAPSNGPRTEFQAKQAIPLVAPESCHEGNEETCHGQRGGPNPKKDEGASQRGRMRRLL